VLGGVPIGCRPHRADDRLAAAPGRKKVTAMKRTTVGDVMTTRVVAVKNKASFKEMITKLRDFRISAFPVVDDEGRVIGVVSEAGMPTREADLAGRELVERVRHSEGVVAVRDRLSYAGKIS
jgi:CBS-domain-containing membrane protein